MVALGEGAVSHERGTPVAWLGGPILRRLHDVRCTGVPRS